ncbi:hypothetical protein ATANTOWER_024317 [Ataeniobius toweri]|uniref:Uncharacterized protein n=1 Tax=Ataeniobius toweri TaxID=208326 RepID=A0ABU7C9Y5_9TELE|nr:hypothetical protein [Ataeniobius toweri]
MQTVLKESPFYPPTVASIKLKVLQNSVSILIQKINQSRDPCKSFERAEGGGPALTGAAQYVHHYSFNVYTLTKKTQTKTTAWIQYLAGYTFTLCRPVLYLAS